LPIKECPLKIQEFYDMVKDNNPFIITGSCKRCGKCCYFLDKRPELGGTRKPCEHLSFDAEGLAVCNIYENRPDICRDFPQVRNREDEDWFNDCGYTIVMGLDDETHTRLNELNILCHDCNVENLEECQARIDAIREILYGA